MGTGASKSKQQQQQPNVVSVTSSFRTTVADNRFVRHIDPPAEGRILNHQKRKASDNKPDTQSPFPFAVNARTTTTTTTKPADGLPAQNKGEVVLTSESTSSLSSRPSSKSVGEELDNLRTELDQVLIGHYYAVTKPASGVLRTAEIAVLERHNQLKPLPIDYQPVVGKTTDGPGPSQWLRPEDLIRQERELMDKIEREEEGERRREEEREEQERAAMVEMEARGRGMRALRNEPIEEEAERRTRDEDREREAETKRDRLGGIAIYDIEDEQDRGDFDVLKFKAVNTHQDEPASTGPAEVFPRATYKNYAARTQGAVREQDKENVSPARPMSSAGPSTMDVDYDASEEALLKSIETEF